MGLCSSLCALRLWDNPVAYTFIKFTFKSTLQCIIKSGLFF